MQMTSRQIINFESKIQKTDTCWLWTGANNIRLYGFFRLNNKTYKAHRVSFELYKETIPKGLCVMHSCDNPSCVNPEHLTLGTLKDNSQDMLKKGRANKSNGEKQHSSKLTIKEVVEIRNKYLSGQYSQERLAKEYGIYQSVIWKVINHKTWKHVA